MKLLVITFVALACVACGTAAPTRPGEPGPHEAAPAAVGLQTPNSVLQVVEEDLENEPTTPESEAAGPQVAPEEEEEETTTTLPEEEVQNTTAVVPQDSSPPLVEKAQPEGPGKKRVRRFGGLPRNGASGKFSPSSRMKHKLGGGGKSRTK